MTAPAPAATCEPQTGTALGTPHWLTHPTRKPIIAIWQADHRGPLWYIGAASGSAFALAELGYRYVCPCPTPEQTADRDAESAAWAEAARGCATDLAAIGAILGAEDPLKATAERERLVRALAKVVGALWNDRNDLDWYSAWDFLELLRDEEIIEMRMPDGRLAGEEDNPNDAEPELTPLGRAAIELAKEPQS